jgi:hypothetical protein
MTRAGGSGRMSQTCTCVTYPTHAGGSRGMTPNTCTSVMTYATCAGCSAGTRRVGRRTRTASPTRNVLSSGVRSSNWTLSLPEMLPIGPSTVNLPPLSWLRGRDVLVPRVTGLEAASDDRRADIFGLGDVVVHPESGGEVGGLACVGGVVLGVSR